MTLVVLDGGVSVDPAFKAGLTVGGLSQVEEGAAKGRLNNDALVMGLGTQRKKYVSLNP